MKEEKENTLLKKETEKIMSQQIQSSNIIQKKDEIILQLKKEIEKADIFFQTEADSKQIAHQSSKSLLLKELEAINFQMTKLDDKKLPIKNLAKDSKNNTSTSRTSLRAAKVEKTANSKISSSFDENSPTNLPISKPTSTKHQTKVPINQRVVDDDDNLDSEKDFESFAFKTNSADELAESMRLNYDTTQLSKENVVDVTTTSSAGFLRKRIYGRKK